MLPVNSCTLLAFSASSRLSQGLSRIRQAIVGKGLELTGQSPGQSCF
jgi:hypothetical protein